MIELVQQASRALQSNDCEDLERLALRCIAETTALEAIATAQTDDERCALQEALFNFQRLVIAARANIQLRRNLLAAHRGGAWAR